MKDVKQEMLDTAQSLTKKIGSETINSGIISQLSHAVYELSLSYRVIVEAENIQQNG